MNVTGLLSALTSHASALGIFDRVNKHEPKSAPGNGISCSIWCESISPATNQSGLASTSGRIVFFARVMTAAFQEPQDGIDPAVMKAVDLLMTAYSADFELGGLIRNVDLLGASGIPLGARAGYLTQDSKVYRVMTITIPLIQNDCWDQVA